VAFEPVWPSALSNARVGLEVDGKTYWSDELDGVSWSTDAEEVQRGRPARALLRIGAPRVDWTIRLGLSDDGQAVVVESRVDNRGGAPVRLGKCCLAEVGGPTSRLDMGTRADQAVLLVCSGSPDPSAVRRVAGGKGVHHTKTLAPLFNPAAQFALCAAFLTFDRVSTEHEVSWRASGGALELRSYCDFEGYSLAPGAAVESERLLLTASRQPHACLDDWADRAARHYRPRIWPQTPVGWVGWSWVDPFRVERYEDVVLRNARAIRRRLAGFDVQYLWVSLGNLKDVLPGNWLQWNVGNFPSGPEKLAEELRKLDFTLGLWIGPFWLCTMIEPERLKAFDDALLRRGGEPLTTPSPWPYGVAADLPPAKRPRMVFLDPTHPKTERLLREVFAAYRRWGVRYYMIDFLDSISGSTPGRYLYDHCYDLTRIPGPGVFRAGLKLVREAVGDDTYLLLCNGAAFQTIGYADGYRVGTDYGEGRPLAPDAYFYPATFVINNPAFWTSHQRATGTLATSSFLHRKFFLADSGNVLTLDKPCPLQDAQTTATIFGINGGPMMIGDDVGRMAPERLALLKKCLPRLPESAAAIDLFDAPEPDYPKRFHLKPVADWDQWDLVALFNYGAEPLQIRVPLERLRLDPAALYVAWDFWNERYEGAVKGELAVWVPPRASRLLRISKARSHPWIVSTDMHVRQGQAEIEQCQWDAQGRTLLVRARRPAGETGNVFLLAPPGWEAANPRGLWLAKDGNDGSLVVRHSLAFTGAPIEVKIPFRPLQSFSRGKEQTKLK
jgi:hypothetical protein